MAAADFFLKLTGIDGEAIDSKHNNEIQIESWSFGVANQTSVRGSASGSGASKASFQDISFTKEIDKSSSPTFLGCCSGKHIDEAKITCRSAGENPVEYLIITVKEVFLTSYSCGGHGGSRASESFSISYKQIEFKYTSQTSTGSPGPQIVNGWNITTNAKT